MRRINDPELVAREYATTERLAARRLDRTAWLRGEDEPWRLALYAIAEVRPQRVLDAGCGNADFAALIAAPEVVCIDTSEAAVEAARRRRLPARTADIERLPFGDGELLPTRSGTRINSAASRGRSSFVAISAGSSGATP